MEPKKSGQPLGGSTGRGGSKGSPRHYSFNTGDKSMSKVGGVIAPQAKIDQYYAKGLYANAAYLEAKNRYKRLDLDWDENFKRLSHAAIDEEKAYNTRIPIHK
jgi:hypothetical protein